MPGEENIGCLGTCNPEYSLTLVTYIDQNDKLLMHWNADKAEKEFPYICQSNCPRGYYWFTSMLNCIVKSVHIGIIQQGRRGHIDFYVRVMRVILSLGA